ncbi:MAG: alanine racemase [Candidatus Omnitrophica bacterium]|nr:alanine racemase [Candidatus Omnitrophota bacterium]
MNNSFITYCEINLDSIIHNLKWVKNRVGEKVKICFAGTKADGYGYGIYEVAIAAIESKVVDYLGVAIPDEGIYLRKKGINIPIIVFGNILPEFAEKIVDYDLTQTVCTYDLCEKLSYYAKNKNKPVKIHIKVDTGMGRIGVFPEDSLEFIKKVSKLPNLKIEGIYSHLSSVGRDDEFTKEQINKFFTVLKILENNNIKIPLKHLANSASIKKLPETYLDMVRPGSIIFNADLPELKQVFSLKSKVVYVKKVPKGYRIGYRGSFITKKETKIATVGLGYIDGYPFLLGNEKWKVIINDKYFPVVGRVCMDQIMVDVGNEDVKIGDEVIIIGKSKNCEIKINDIFKELDFYNFLAPSINKRVSRIYIKDGRIYKTKTMLEEISGRNRN